MDVEQAIHTRRSIRKYLDVPVPWDLVTRVVDSGRLAPNAGNLQNWKFIVVCGKEKREKLAEACLQQFWMAKAPVHIIVCSEPYKAKQYYGIRGERLYSVQNCAAAAANMLLAAHSFGLGACWVGAFDEDMVKRLLGCPDEVRPQVVLTLGYPDEKPPEPYKYHIETVFHFEKWHATIKDPMKFMGYSSHEVEKAVQKTKGLITKVTKKLADQAKEASKKIGEKIKKKHGKW